MRYLPELILSLATGLMALEIIPLYGEMLGGLFGQVSSGLALAGAPA